MFDASPTDEGPAKLMAVSLAHGIQLYGFHVPPSHGRMSDGNNLQIRAVTLILTCILVCLYTYYEKPPFGWRWKPALQDLR